MNWGKLLFALFSACESDALNKVAIKKGVNGKGGESKYH